MDRFLLNGLCCIQLFLISKEQRMIGLKTRSSNSAKKMSLIDAVAIASSVAILVAAGLFWLVQIQSVIELLRLAYG